MKHYFISLFLILVAVSTFNIVIDPTFQWRRNATFPNSEWNESQAWISPKNFDVRQFRIHELAIRPRADTPHTLILGSSRHQPIRMLKTDKPWFNAALNSATIEDFIAIWQAFNEKNEFPKQVIIGIDPWTYQISRQRTGWFSYSDKFHEYCEKNSIKIDLFQTKSWIAAKSVLTFKDKIASILSWQHLSASLNEVFSKTNENQNLGTLIAISETPEEHESWLKNGNIQYPKKATKTKSTQEWNSINVGFLAKNSDALKEILNFEVDPLRFNQLKKLIQDLDEKQIETHLVISPYNPFVYQKLVTNAQTNSSLKKYIETTRSLLETTKHTKLCVLLDPKQVGCDTNDFVDAVHPGTDCNDKILQKCDFSH